MHVKGHVPEANKKFVDAAEYLQRAAHVTFRVFAISCEMRDGLSVSGRFVILPKKDKGEAQPLSRFCGTGQARLSALATIKRSEIEAQDAHDRFNPDPTSDGMGEAVVKIEIKLIKPVR